MSEQVFDDVSNIYYSTLIPPMYLGETGKISSLPFIRGGLGWGITVIKIEDNTF